jgi:hypothetical protein
MCVIVALKANHGLIRLRLVVSNQIVQLVFFVYI